MMAVISVKEVVKIGMVMLVHFALEKEKLELPIVVAMVKTHKETKNCQEYIPDNFDEPVYVQG
jgi:hypothetical protein